MNGAQSSVEDYSQPGYADTWTDVETHKKKSAALLGQGGSAS